MGLGVTSRLGTGDLLFRFVEQFQSDDAPDDTGQEQTLEPRQLLGASGGRVHDGEHGTYTRPHGVRGAGGDASHRNSKADARQRRGDEEQQRRGEEGEPPRRGERVRPHGLEHRADKQNCPVLHATTFNPTTQLMMPTMSSTLARLTGSVPRNMAQATVSVAPVAVHTA